MPVFRRILTLLFRPGSAWSGIAGDHVTLDGLPRMRILPFSPIETASDSTDVFDRLDQIRIRPDERNRPGPTCARASCSLNCSCVRTPTFAAPLGSSGAASAHSRVAAS